MARVLAALVPRPTPAPQPEQRLEAEGRTAGRAEHLAISQPGDHVTGGEVVEVTVGILVAGLGSVVRRPVELEDEAQIDVLHIAVLGATDTHPGSLLGTRLGQAVRPHDAIEEPVLKHAVGPSLEVVEQGHQECPSSDAWPLVERGAQPRRNRTS